MGKLAHLLDIEETGSRLPSRDRLRKIWEDLEEQVNDRKERDNDWKEMLIAVDNQLTEFHKHIDAVQAKAESDREAVRKELAALRALITSVGNKSAQDVRAAVAGIKIPSMPDQVRTDLTPVLRRLDAIAEREAMDAKNKTEPAEKPEEWVFDIIRGPNGGLLQVRAKEV